MIKLARVATTTEILNLLIAQEVAITPVQACFRVVITVITITIIPRVITIQITRAYIKKLNVKIDSFVMRRVPIGFSAKPIKTLLLGRARIFDLLNVYLDCKSKETIIFTPDELASSKDQTTVNGMMNQMIT
jgi:hypothetical protein